MLCSVIADRPDQYKEAKEDAGVYQLLKETGTGG